MLKSPEKEKVKSGARLLIRKLAEASAIRAPQADTIAHEITASPHPYIIVCGDFNDTPISYTHRTMPRIWTTHSPNQDGGWASPTTRTDSISG